MGFDVIGTRSDEEQKKYLIKDIKGIKVGFINYGYETIRQNGKKALNGVVLDESVAPLVNSFDYDNKQAFYDEVEEILTSMKNEGAEFFVVYIHWGNEYRTKQNSHQEEIAQNLCELGIDVIIGAHPHVLQPADVITSEDTGKKTLCFYSLGNFISNQRIEYMNLKTGHTEDGIMVKLISASTGMVKLCCTVQNTYLPGLICITKGKKGYTKYYPCQKLITIRKIII